VVLPSITHGIGESTKLVSGNLQGTIDRGLHDALVDAPNCGELGIGGLLEAAARVEGAREVADERPGRDQVEEDRGRAGINGPSLLGELEGLVGSGPLLRQAGPKHKARRTIEAAGL
jgi:hypothetical protein